MSMPDLSRPLLDPDAEPFFEGTRNGELRVQKCPDTGRLIFPPRPMSPWGKRRTPEWVTVSGRGTLWSYSVPHPPLMPPFTDLAPYNVVIVALDEDPKVRLVGNLVESEGGPINAVDPSTIEIGMPVRVVFEKLDDEITIPRWIKA